ncbi:MAG: O-antigen ligase family protein [Cyanobacteriota bacterium]|nr:O-antigen ligase family protein [Cyanobacteriota bacterium]
MLDSLKEPLILALLLGAGFLYFLIAFHIIGRNKFYAELFEKSCIGLFLTIIAGATGAGISILPKLHPRILSLVVVTPPTVILQLGFYALVLAVLIPRLRHTLRDFISAIGVLFVQDGFFSLFLLLIGLSAFWSNTPEVTLKTSLVYLETSVIAIYVGKQYSWTQLFQISRWVSCFLLISSILYNAAGSGKDEFGSWMGLLGHKNQFGFFMAFTVALWFIHAIYNKKQRSFSIAVIFLGMLALNFSQSGAARVIVVCLLALWFYLGFAKKLPAQWAFVSVVLFLIVSICLTILVTENLEFIVVDTLNKDLTLTGRTEFWPLVIDKINERPLLGYGIDGFWQPWRGPDNPARSIIVAKTQFTPPHSHNGFLDLALDLGYGGLAIFMMSFLSSIAKSVIFLSRAPMPEAGLPLLVITYVLMTNLTETGLLGVTSIWFWYVVVVVRTSLDTTMSPELTRR